MKTMTDPKRAQQYFADKMSFTTGPAELKRWLDAHECLNIVDVRRREDYDEGHIPGALSLPKDEWHEGESALAKDKINVLYCYSAVCHLAPEAALVFSRKGYPVMELEGGFDAWTQYKLPVEAAQPAVF